MSGKTDKDVPGSDAEGPGQGGETPAARHAADEWQIQLPHYHQCRSGCGGSRSCPRGSWRQPERRDRPSPDFQTASPAGRLHRRLREAAGTQKTNDLNEPVAEEGFKTTKKEALEEEREEQRLRHQAEMDSLFDRRFNGDPDLQPVMNPVQEATALLVVGELQPEVTAGARQIRDSQSAGGLHQGQEP